MTLRSSCTGTVGIAVREGLNAVAATRDYLETGYGLSTIFAARGRTRAPRADDSIGILLLCASGQLAFGNLFRHGQTEAKIQY